MAILKYLSLHSGFYDLGIFFSHFYNIANRGQLWRLFYGHSQPLMLLYAAVYRIIPEYLSAIAVLIFQAFFIVLPGYWLQKRFGWLPFLAFVLYFPIWYNALFDFHMDHLAVPLLFWFYFLVEDERYWLAIFPGVLLALVKEPFALQTAACGIFLLLKAYRSHWAGGHLPNYLSYLPGILLFLFGCSYFYAVVNFIFPALTGNRGGLDSSAFGWMGSGIKNMLIFIVFHPVVIIKEIFGMPGKIFYLLVLFGSLGFISILKPLYLIPALPILGISLLSRLDNHYSIGHHYTAGLIAPMIMAFVMGLAVFKKFCEKFGLKKNGVNFILCAIFLLSHILLSPSPLSQMFWRNKVWSDGWQAYIPTKRNKMIKEAIKKYIPADPNVVVSTQNSLNWSYLAHRKYYFCFPTGVTEPAKVPDFSNKGLKQFLKYITNHKLQTPNYKLIYADYVLLDLKRLWFIKDMGCNKWKDGQCYDQTFSKKFLNLIKETKKKYSLIYEKDGFMIFHRLVSKKTSVFN